MLMTRILLCLFFHAISHLFCYGMQLKGKDIDETSVVLWVRVLYGQGGEVSRKDSIKNQKAPYVWKQGGKVGVRVKIRGCQHGWFCHVGRRDRMIRT